ncbi:MAG: type 4a pilus biogenesis protein PilO [bacterium]|nr:type 4a pilus biogenesis protein PilO [bacterium]
MNSFIADIAARPLKQRLAIWIGTLLVIGFLLWANMYSPNYDEYIDSLTKLDSLKSELSKEKKLALNLEKFKQDVRDLDVKLQFAIQELPDKNEIPELLSSVSRLAKESGLEVNLFRVNAERLDEFYARVPVEITVFGSYHQVASFFDAVAHLPRIVNISQIEMLEPNPNNGVANIRINCIATTFRYITPEEQNNSAQEGSDRPKRR